jgi:serine-protein kinase ATM
LPAIKELKGMGDGREAGRVYHEFAFFCDQQLQSADGLDEFSRVQKIRQQKEAEVKDLGKMIESTQDKQKGDLLKSHYLKAQQWYKLDDAEYQRLRQTRETFLKQSLENYLLSLRACDDYANDVLRFCAMWLDNSGSRQVSS